jgi:spectinomycin phosphotransferase
MLTKPGISDDTIIACLYDSFGLHISKVTFLPLGYVNSAVYRVTADSGTPYFLKLRQGNFNEIAVAVPAFLHAQGIRQVMAPIATTTHTLWVHVHGFDWILYPFFDGKTGFEIALSKTQWIALGQSMNAVHATILPAGLAERVPREDYSPGWRNIVRAFHKQVEQDRYDDPTAASFAALLMTKRDEIQCIVERAEQLAQALQNRVVKLAVCHSDLHGRNVLVGTDDEMAIVDWDAPILAPKERDLMFIGGGVGGIWNDDQEAKWFYQGYGQTEIDLVALTYYRYERIVEDIAEYSERIFGMQGSVQDRQKGLRLKEQFLPNNVVEIAHRSYQQLSERVFG